MQRINIIKYIEEKENKDIFQDYYSILIILDGQKYSHKPLYNFKKSWFETTPSIYYDIGFGECDEEDKSYEKKWIELIHDKGIENKSQIANRIQYIKQSGYEFKEYMVNDDILTIVFE